MKPNIVFVPDSGTGYSVRCSGVCVGRVVRVAADGGVSWSWYGPNGEYGTGYKTRTGATRELLSLSRDRATVTAAIEAR